MSATPLRDSIPDGMTLFGNGCPVAGLRMICGVLKNRFEPSSSLKSPARIAAVGTVTFRVSTWKKSTHSCAPKKNSFSFKAPGIGPPKA